jgi:hypothetical protein
MTKCALTVLIALVALQVCTAASLRALNEDPSTTIPPRPSGPFMYTYVSPYAGDLGGYNIRATFNSIQHISFNSANSMVYVVDTHTVMGINNTDVVTIAGTGQPGSTGDGGSSRTATLNTPTNAIYVEKYNKLYISESIGYRIREVDLSTLTINTICGTGVSGTYNGDNKQCTTATIYPYALAFDDVRDVLYIAGEQNRIRALKISTGVIITVAGTGSAGTTGDGGYATSATIGQVKTMFMDSVNNKLYFAESNYGKIRVINFNSGIISKVAGTGTTGYSGDNNFATSAQFSDIRSINVDVSANMMYICDTVNARMRYIDMTSGVVKSVTTTDYASDYGDYIDQLSFAKPIATAFDYYNEQAYIVSRDNRIVVASGFPLTPVATTEPPFGTTTLDPAPGPTTLAPGPAPGPSTVQPGPAPGPTTLAPGPAPGPSTDSPVPGPSTDSPAPGPSPPGPSSPTTIPPTTPGATTTSPPIEVSAISTVSSSVTGDASKIPSPTGNAVVLYKSSAATSTVSIKPSQTALPTNGRISKIILQYQVTELSGTVDIRVYAYDGDKRSQNSKLFRVSSKGTQNGDVTSIFSGRRVEQVVVSGRQITYGIEAVTSNTALHIDKEAAVQIKYTLDGSTSAACVASYVSFVIIVVVVVTTLLY